MKRSVISLLLLLAAATANAAVTGKVINKTTGQPAAGVPVTLIKMQVSMDPVGETFTNAAGEFSFDEDLLDASGNRTVGMLRAELQSVNYSHILPPVVPITNVEIEVFNSSTAPFPPTRRILVLEPGPEQVVVNENYLFTNDSNPPVTYRNANGGALEFYLPPEAKGIVQVEGKGPAGMPLNSSADPAGEQGVYKVDFPIKPGDNSISLTYVAARPPEGQPLLLPSRYPNVQTRVAAPQGLEITGPNLNSLGVYAEMQAQIFEVTGTSDVSLMITGSAALPRAEASAEGGAGGGSPNQISVQNAPVAAEVWWILAVITGILAIGFYNLNTSKA